LLDSQYTRVQRNFDPSWTEAKDLNPGLIAYNFHTNILAVNRAIRTEAEELLYKRNVFVVVSYEWPEMEEQSEYGGLIWVPMVSKKHVSRMSRHSARIHISESSNSREDTALTTRAKVTVKAYILLASDIEAFCITLGGLLYRSRGRALLLDNATVPGAPPAVEMQDVHWKPPQFKCELRDAEYRLMDRATQHQLLSSFASLIAAGQRVTFKGKICDEVQTRDLKRIMGPGILSPSAQHYNAAEMMIKAKCVTDAALEQDDLSFALGLCRLCMDCSLGTVSDKVMQSDPQIMSAMFITYLEVMVNIACCMLKLGRYTECALFAQRIGSTLMCVKHDLGDSWEMPLGIEAYCFSISMWCMLSGELNLGINPSDMETVGSTVGALAKFARQHQHQALDYETLKRYHDQEAKLTKEVLPLCERSLYKLPFHGTTSYGTEVLSTLRGRFRGWQDIDLLRSLNHDQKQQINSLQKWYHLEVTDFDQL
jgi:hypothetical protein